MSDDDVSQASSHASSPASKRRRTGPAAMGAVLNEALEVVETLVEEGHVNTHAHNQIAKALKRVNDVDASDRTKAVRDAVLKVVAECGFTLGPVMCADVGEIGVFETKFIRKLFRQRLSVEPKPCTMFTPDWIEEIIEFYVPKPSDGETRDELYMQRDMILSLLHAAPQGVNVVKDLLQYLDKQKIAPRALVADDFDEGNSWAYWETNGWLEDVLDCAPEMAQWAAPESDTSKWAKGVRSYADDLQ